MSLRRYFQPKDGLPDAQGPLSRDIPSRAIVNANREVSRVISEEAGSKKRGPYNRYSAEERAQIGRYAVLYGATAAASVFSKKLNRKVSTTTAHSIMKDYRGVKRRADDEVVSSLPVKKRGRPVLLGETVDIMVQKYLKKVREGGGVVTARVAIAAANAIIKTQDHTKLFEFGGHIDLDLSWAYSLLKRMKFVKRRASTAKSKLSVQDFEREKREFLDDLVAVVNMEDIPPELVLNWDQTGIKLVPVSSHTLERQGSSRVEVTGVNDKRLITALFCASLTGDFLPVQVIYQGKTDRCHPKFHFPTDWHITHSPKHWSNEVTMIDYIKAVVIPYVSTKRDDFGEDTSAVVIMDNFKGQVTSPVQNLLEDNNIHVCLLPPNTTDRLQPLDVSVNKPAKDFLRKKYEEWFTEQIVQQLEGEDVENIDGLDLVPIDLSAAVVKHKSAKWLVELAEYMGNHPDIIVNGFIKTGIAAALDGESTEDQESEDQSEPEDEEFVDNSEQ